MQSISTMQDEKESLKHHEVHLGDRLEANMAMGIELEISEYELKSATVSCVAPAICYWPQ